MLTKENKQIWRALIRAMKQFLSALELILDGKGDKLPH